MWAGVRAHDGRRGIPGAEAKDGLAEMAYDGLEPTTELNSTGEDFRSSAEAVYSQVGLSICNVNRWASLDCIELWILCSCCRPFCVGVAVCIWSHLLWSSLINWSACLKRRIRILCQVGFRCIDGVIAEGTQARAHHA